jgi:DNA processing protein
MAVPGNALNGRNRGGHALIRDGAKIVETADDILEELAPDRLHRPEPLAASNGVSAAAADAVLDSLPPGEVCDLDTISARSGLPASGLLPRLLTLELGGRVSRVAGGRFVRS